MERPSLLERSGRPGCGQVASMGARRAIARPRHGESPRIELDGQEQIFAGRDALEEAGSKQLEI